MGRIESLLETDRLLIGSVLKDVFRRGKYVRWVFVNDAGKELYVEYHLEWYQRSEEDQP